MNAERIAEQKQVRPQPQPSLAALIQQVLDSEHFREVFEFRGRVPVKVRRARPDIPIFRRVLERAVNPDVDNRRSWAEIKPIVEYITRGLPIAKKIDLDSKVLEDLYITERYVHCRLVRNFMLQYYYSGEIENQRQEAVKKAVSPLKNRAERELYLQLATQIFREAILKR